MLTEVLSNIVAALLGLLIAFGIGLHSGKLMETTTINYEVHAADAMSFNPEAVEALAEALKNLD